MQCPCPESILDPRGTTNAVRLPVPCGKCPICLQNKRADWSFRLTEELRNATTANFITLTYNDEFCPSDFSLDKTHIQLFNKRLRKYNKKPIRFYATGEYGGQTNRPHYHGIYFGMTQKTQDNLENIWKNGHVDVRQCNDATIHYVTKYVIQNYDHDDDRQKPFALMSNRPALGHQYIERNEERHIKNQNTFVVKNGFKQKMPKYYKDKIFTQSEKENHAKENALRINNKWLANYDKHYRQTELDVIENQFRIINNQSKSK